MAKSGNFANPFKRVHAPTIIGGPRSKKKPTHAPATVEVFWDLVRTLPCQFPDCKKHGPSELSHSNQSRDGKGRGLLSFWWRVAAICTEHHTMIDSGNKLARADRIALWDEAHRATLGECIERGFLIPVTQKS